MAYTSQENLVVLVRTGYLSSAALVFFIYLVKPLRTRFLAYGLQLSDQHNKTSKKDTPSSSLTLALDRLATILVPHSWFTSFYAVSVTCSLFWVSQVLLPTSLIHGFWLQDPHKQCMTWRQVQLTWLLMLMQGSRRLYECIAFYRPSQSQMWLGHWILGVGFYFATSVAVWVEGLGSIQSHTLAFKDLYIAAPDIRTTIGMLLFILASGVQYDCHEYLASLKTSSCTTASSPQASATAGYKLPKHPAFHSLVAPHYFAECIIYLALAIVATPPGAWLNWTLFCALIFVVVNLGVTAHGTKRWYEAKFGKASVEKRWRMIPYVF